MRLSEKEYSVAKTITLACVRREEEEVYAILNGRNDTVQKAETGVIQGA
jgi:hypothetical protein